MSSNSELAKNLCGFSAALYGKVIGSQHGKQVNTFVCPPSIYTALAMTLAGSKGSTEEELKRVMNLSAPVNHSELGSSLNQFWAKSDGIDLDSANRLFILRPVKVKETFKGALSKNYSSEAETLGGLPNDEARRGHINTWVAKSTKELIKELIPAGSITPNSMLMLVNALSFKGSWKYRFPDFNTNSGSFHRHNGTSYPIQMMTNNASFPYAELEDVAAQALKLPFESNVCWEMLIVLPFGHDGLPEVQQYLENPDNLKKLLSEKFENTNVSVTLPKFRLSHFPMLDVAELLKKLGVNKLFDAASADLSEISDELKLFVSAIFHQAVLEVDEKGATAAAGTAVQVANRMIRRDPIFKVDRPFFVAIVKDKTIPLFLGHVWEPEPN